MTITVSDDSQILDFIADCTVHELRAVLVSLSANFPAVAAAAIDGIRRGRLERDQDALRRAVAERGTL